MDAILLYNSRKTNTMHRFTPLLYFIRWLLHVSAVVCHLQGASGSVWVAWKIQIDVVVYHIVWLSGLCVGSVEVQSVVLPRWVHFIVVTNMFRPLLYDHIQGSGNTNINIIKTCINHSTVEWFRYILIITVFFFSLPWKWSYESGQKLLVITIQ
jgi:hypothetical protein